jgi:hypothetical protein
MRELRKNIFSDSGLGDTDLPEGKVTIDNGILYLGVQSTGPVNWEEGDMRSCALYWAPLAKVYDKDGKPLHLEAGPKNEYGRRLAQVVELPQELFEELLSHTEQNHEKQWNVPGLGTFHY